MFKTVLVPLDGSPQAAAALPLARTLARATEGSLALVRVVADTGAEPEATHYLERVASELQDMRARYSVRRGTAAHEVVAAAREQPADVIVMATHGRMGLQRALLGSVAERVLVESPVPLVLVRPGGKRVTHLTRLLVPTDGTVGGSLALGTAVGLATASSARLTLVQAVEPIPLWVYGSEFGVAPSYVDPEWEQEGVDAARTYIEGVVKRLQTAGLNADGYARLGTAVSTIEAVADETDADLIVMSTHALTGPARTLLGSTADALVRTARRPVLLVRRTQVADGEQLATVSETSVAAVAG